MKTTADRIEARREQLIEAERLAVELEKVCNAVDQRAMSGFHEDLGKKVWECGRAVVSRELEERLEAVLSANPDGEHDA